MHDENEMMDVDDRAYKIQSRRFKVLDEAVRQNTYIRTYTGRQFFLMRPTAEMVSLDDVAHALARLCRYTGHCSAFYSVAQHSVLMSKLASSKEVAQWCLLHDAAEAYVGDVSTPLKLLLPNYREIEKKIMGVIAERFGLVPEKPEEMDHLDQVMLATEQRDLMPTRDGCPDVKPNSSPVQPWTVGTSETQFIFRFDELFRIGENRHREVLEVDRFPPSW